MYNDTFQGPKLPFSIELYKQKYCGPGETHVESCDRVAGALCDEGDHFRYLQNILRDQRFLTGGRVMASMGATKMVSPINCYMSGDFSDSFVSGPGNIMQRATEAAATMRLGGGIGTNFSTLRPSGAIIRKLGSTSSGPVSFMEIFNAVGHTIASSGHRRGAQMGVLMVDHPDIETFIHAKNNDESLTAFNMSAMVTDEFMIAVENDGMFELRFNGEVYQTIKADALWNMIMRSTYDYAEPGVIFIDQIERENNLWYCEKITGTNPCGEIPLPEFGACLLGSFNLVKYLNHDRSDFDYYKLLLDIPHCVRALDNVIDRASCWPLPEQEREMKSKRRIGIGVTGLANAIEAMGHRYGSLGFNQVVEGVMSFIRSECYKASIELSIEKGPFPMFDADKFLDSGFCQRLPFQIQEDIRAYGIRNSHLLAIAPTGTISLTADNVSSGLEPVFAHEFDRVWNTATEQRIEKVQDYAFREWGILGATAGELSPEEHLSVLKTCTPYVDQSISKTVNVKKDIPWDDFKNIYMQAWKAGCKGITTYRVGGKRGALLTAKADEDAASCGIDPTTGRQECS